MDASQLTSLVTNSNNCGNYRIFLLMLAIFSIALNAIWLQPKWLWHLPEFWNWDEVYGWCVFWPVMLLVLWKNNSVWFSFPEAVVILRWGLLYPRLASNWLQQRRPWTLDPPTNLPNEHRLIYAVQKMNQVLTMLSQHLPTGLGPIPGDSRHKACFLLCGNHLEESCHCSGL